MTYGTLVATRHGPVELIELISDDGLNCYRPEMGEDLVEALRGAAADDGVAAIVLTGRGRAFCAGAHRSVLAGEIGPSGLRIGQEAFVTDFAPEFAALPKLTITAFNGSAAGIGVTMSLLCDLRLAVSGAKLRLNFAELGIMPGLGSTVRLPALIGPSAAKKLLLCDRLTTTEQAVMLGLIDEIVPSETLVDRALELGRAAADCKGETLSHIKRCLDAGGASIPDAVVRESEAARLLRETA